MGKSAVVTLLYVSVAWTLMVSYMLFTQTAVEASTIKDTEETKNHERSEKPNTLPSNRVMSFLSLKEFGR